MFRSLDKSFFGEETVEIGVSDGLTSSLHFEGREIDVGIEYLTDRLHSPLVFHRHKLSADLRNLPLKPYSQRVILLVHVFDDLSFDLDVALVGLSKVLKRDGFLVFSTASSHYGNHQTYEKLREVFPIDRCSFETYRSTRYRGIRTYTREQLESSLRRFGMEIVRYEEFLSDEWASNWDIGMSVEMSGVAPFNCYSIVNSKYEKVVLDAFHAAMRLEERSNPIGNKAHCFVVARKL